MNKTTEALELAEALENDAKEHREVSYGLDCPPERTANWKHALNCEAAARLIREVLAESKPAPDGRIPKTVFTLDDISKAAEMGKQAGMIDALAEPVKQEPVAWWNGKETAWFEHELCGWQAPDGCTIPLYAAPVSTEAIRAEERQRCIEAIRKAHHKELCDVWDCIEVIKELE